MISDKTQALLDLLAGWNAFVSRQQERDEGETDEAYLERMQSYPDDYSALIFELYQGVIPATEDEGLSAAKFLEQRVQPLLK
jgi:hypothetical protein